MNSGRPPMLRDLMWIMKLGDKQGTATCPRRELRRLLVMYRNHMRKQVLRRPCLAMICDRASALRHSHLRSAEEAVDTAADN